MTTYTYSYTGTPDEIININFVGDLDIDVTFKGHGLFRVNRIFSQSAFLALSKMQTGQKVLLAQDKDRVMWVKPV